MSRTKETTINPSKWGLKWEKKIRERTLTQIWSLKNEELGVIFSWRIGQMGKKVMWELLIFKNWIWLSNVHKNNAGKWSMIGWSASICCWHWILLVKEQPKSVNSEYSRPLSSLVEVCLVLGLGQLWFSFPMLSKVQTRIERLLGYEYSSIWFGYFLETKSSF